MATPKSTKSSTSASSSIIFTGLSDKQVSSLRAAKQAAAQRLLPSKQVASFSAFSASTSPDPTKHPRACRNAYAPSMSRS